MAVDDDLIDGVTTIFFLLSRKSVDPPAVKSELSCVGANFFELKILAVTQAISVLFKVAL